MTVKTMDVGAALTALALAAVAATAHAGDQEWTDISPPIPVTRFAVSPAAPGILYAAGADGIQLSEDGGASWSSRNAGLTITDITAIAAAPNDPNRVVAAERGHQLVVSNNRGASWSAGPSAAVNLITAIAFDPNDDDIIYALDDGLGSVFKSTNGGITWTQHTAGLPASVGPGDQLALVVVPLEPDTLYTGTPDGVYRSDDAGATWVRAHGDDLPSTAVVALAEHPGEPNTVAALLRVGDTLQFWRTNQRGENWYRPGEDPEAKFRAQAVVVDQHDPSRLLLGGGNGVYASVDAATHWIDLNAGLGPTVSPADRRFDAVRFDPHQTRRYYAVTEGTLQVYDGMIAIDLIVDAAATPARVDHGDSTEIAFTVTNITGESATGVGFVVAAPAGFEVQSYAFDAADCGLDGGTLTCSLAVLGPGAAVAGTLAARATGGDGIHDFALSATAAEREATPASNNVVIGVRIGDAPADDGGNDSDAPTGPTNPDPTEPTTPQQPRTPTGGSSGGGSGGWLWLLGAGLAGWARRQRR